MDRLPEIERLHADYCHYWSKTRHVVDTRKKHFMRNPSLNAARRKQLQAMVDWCDARGYDPRRWLAAAFENRRWLFAPPWHQLCTKGVHAWYDRGDLPEYDALLRAEAELENPPLNPNVDIIPEGEVAKASYADPRECMSSFHTTYGWHPKSRVCAKCPAAEECKALLQANSPIDIISLREGRLTWQEVALGARCVRGQDTGGTQPDDVRRQLPDGLVPDALRGPPPRR